MFCFTRKKFQNILNETITERLDEYWYAKLGNGKIIFLLFSIVFILIPNCLWVRGILKTNRQLLLPQKLNLFCGVLSLIRVFLLTVDAILNLGNILTTACWKITLTSSLLFSLLLKEVVKLLDKI